MKKKGHLEHIKSITAYYLRNYASKQVTPVELAQAILRLDPYQLVKEKLNWHKTKWFFLIR